MTKRAALLTCIILAAGATPAAASGHFNPYIGVDAARTVVDFKNGVNNILDDTANGYHVYVGNRFTRFFGIEAGFFDTFYNSHNSVVGTTKWKTHGWNVDLVGYYPIDSAGRFEVLGTAGGTWASIRAKLGTAGDAEEEDINPRFGLGLQYSITDHVAARGMARWQSTGFKDAGDVWTYSAGLNYNF